MSDVADFISEIETMYRREYKDEENSFIRDRLFSKNYDRKVLYSALDDIEKIDSDYLPAPKKVVAVVEKVNYDMTPKKPFKTEQASVSKTDRQFKMYKQITRLFSSGATRQNILDMIREADKVDNSMGWANTGMALDRHYRFHKVDLNKAPNNVVSEDV